MDVAGCPSLNPFESGLMASEPHNEELVLKILPAEGKRSSRGPWNGLWWVMKSKRLGPGRDIQRYLGRLHSADEGAAAQKEMAICSS